jgi:hypothetical protein
VNLSTVLNLNTDLTMAPPLVTLAPVDVCHAPTLHLHRPHSPNPSRRRLKPARPLLPVTAAAQGENPNPLPLVREEKGRHE